MLSKKHQLHPLYRLYPDIRIPNNNKLWSPVLCRLYLCNSLLLSGSESRWCVISDFLFGLCEEERIQCSVGSFHFLGELYRIE